MSSDRGKFSTEYKVQAAHRVIDSGRSVVEVANVLQLVEQSLGRWVRDERRRMEAAKGNELGDVPCGGGFSALIVALSTT